MPNKLELLDEVITSLFKVGDKSGKEYDRILDEFNISELQDMKDFPQDKLQKILNRVKSVLKTGSKNMFTSKNFDREVGEVLLRQAIKLAEEIKEEEKEVPNDVPEEEKKTSPAEEEKKEDQEGGETEEEKIEDIVKDQQISLIEKMNAVKSFKPGRSEAINFRNAVNELIKVAESAVSSINDYYQKELGSEKNKEEEKISASKKKAASKPLKFINTFEMKKAFEKLSKKLGSSIKKDIDTNSIKFINDNVRRQAFDILGENYIKKVTDWKGGSIFSNKEASDESYYKSEVQKLFPVDEYGVKVQLSSEQGKTKWLNLNKISLNVISTMLKGLI